MGHRLRSTYGFLAVVLLSIGGCAVRCSGTLANGRSVEATTDGLGVGGAFGKDTAMINFGAKKVVIEPERVVVEEKVVAPLDPAAKKIAVSSVRGEIVVTADEKVVYDSTGK